MKKSITRQETTPAESMVLRPGTAHLEPFNGSNAMLFFDPVLRGVFGGELASVTEILADDTGIELLIARLEESDEEVAWDA